MSIILLIQITGIYHAMHGVLRVLSLLCCTLGEAARPRGVRPELATMYNPGQAFKCFDGSNTVAFAMVNDDYCDCEVSDTITITAIAAETR